MLLLRQESIVSFSFFCDLQCCGVRFIGRLVVVLQKAMVDQKLNQLQAERQFSLRIVLQELVQEAVCFVFPCCYSLLLVRRIFVPLVQKAARIAIAAVTIATKEFAHASWWWLM